MVDVSELLALAERVEHKGIGAAKAFVSDEPWHHGETLRSHAAHAANCFAIAAALRAIAQEKANG